MEKTPSSTLKRMLEKRIPAIRSYVEKKVSKDFGDWLVEIRVVSRNLGQLAIGEASAARQREEELRIKQRQAEEQSRLSLRDYVYALNEEEEDDEFGSGPESSDGGSSTGGLLGFDKETRPGSPITSFDEHPPVYCVEYKDLDSILMNEEVKADEGEDLQQDTWSARTRKVVKFLEKTFLEQREREEEETVSLLQLCRRRTQKQSARLFYETLVLKMRGYLQVKQDHPYGDVLLKPFTRQQQEAC